MVSSALFLIVYSKHEQMKLCQIWIYLITNARIKMLNFLIVLIYGQEIILDVRAQLC